MYSKKCSAALFLPSTLEKLDQNKESFLSIMSKIDKYSKTIDGVLVNFPSFDWNNVEIWAFDLTIRKDTAEEKLKNFIT